jgi:hypothetical protein
LYERQGDRVTGCCVIGAATRDERAARDVLSRLPEGARGAIADGFDGRLYDKTIDTGDGLCLRRWHALGERLRRAYRPAKAVSA